MYIYTYIYIYVYIRLRVSVSIYISIHADISIQIYIYRHLYTYIYISISMYAHIERECVYRPRLLPDALLKGRSKRERRSAGVQKNQQKTHENPDCGPTRTTKVNSNSNNKRKGNNNPTATIITKSQTQSNSRRVSNIASRTHTHPQAQYKLTRKNTPTLKYLRPSRRTRFQC
jgi:hypothetical protein